MAEEPKPPVASEAQAQQQVQFTVDTSAVSSSYTNWYRVTGTPEELILDFGLNPQMGQVPTETIKLTQRLVMNFYTAKHCSELCSSPSSVTKVSLGCWKWTSKSGSGAFPAAAALVAAVPAVCKGRDESRGARDE